jgi:hypothetical protein
MSKRKFSLVTAILLLLLVGAIMNNIFLYHAYNDTMKEAVQQAQQPVTASGPAGPGYSRTPTGGMGFRQIPGPAWYADVYLSKTGSGEYDIVVEAFVRGSRTLTSVDTVELDVRKAGEPDQTVPAAAQMKDGKYVAHVAFPSEGAWEVRIRMHRGNETLEFAEKFDLKD